MISSRTLRGLALPSMLAAVLATGCLNTTELPPEAQIETTTFATSLGVDLAHSTKLSSGTVIRDITIGTGVPAMAPDRVSVHYSGYFPSGAKFDENVAPTSPFQFPFGKDSVIAGFEDGVAGMQVGGRRQIIIPPSRGYGYNGIPGAIPGNTILVFNVELVARNP